MKQAQGFPQITAPVVDLSTGQLNQVWYQFFVTLFNRTGGPSGGNNPLTPVKITTISPFNYKVPTSGNIWVSPGCYCDVKLTRGGMQLDFGYITRGIFPVNSGDTIEFTFTNLPPTIYLI